MKNFIIGFLFCLCLVMSTAAISAYQQFGPVQMKALVKVIVEEFNRNRDWHGKARITGDDVRDALRLETDNLQTNLFNDPDLDWIIKGEK